MKIALFQQRLVWGDVEQNLHTVESWLSEQDEKADLLVLPEMFATGFGVDLSLSEDSSSIVQRVRTWCATYDLAIAFTVMVREGDDYYNRAFFLTPEGLSYQYDKRHLFCIGIEGERFKAGTERVVVPYKGWNILLQICYDLRFPVFSRNVDNQYDLVLYMANWPIARIAAWKTLLQARAIENEAYACGVNVVGVDPNGCAHGGHSMCVDMKGKILSELPEVDPAAAVVDLSIESVREFRKKFPAWRDSDPFSLFNT